ncbi:MAG TPA: ABC transporter permease [Micromonosporaceae bacterium]|nr:ABC transporter permease [Micromonosporaceae bacterium]
MKLLTLAFWEVVLAGSVRLAVPLALAALGETLVERSGILNLGVEGMMIMGALAGVWAAVGGGSWAGVAAGAAVGALLGALMALAVVGGGANQVVIGVALTLLGTGLASFLFQAWIPSGRQGVGVSPVPVVRVPGLADLPLVGPALFAQNLLMYGTLALVPALAWMLRRSRFGLAVRAVGDDPAAAALRGVATARVRTLTLVAGGALAGVAGAAITVGYLGSFTDGVTAGRGFVAVAIVIIGNWTPLGALAGALLFAFCDSLALHAQSGGVVLPVEAWSALPYLVTLAVLVVTSRRRRAPRALGV